VLGENTKVAHSESIVCRSLSETELKCRVSGAEESNPELAPCSASTPSHVSHTPGPWVCVLLLRKGLVNFAWTDLDLKILL
jgi:hypothetical protein